MTPNEYQELALRTETTPLWVNRFENGQPVPDKLLSRLMHGLLGMCTETGEAQDMVKRHAIYGKPLDLVNILEECGDKLWYIALALGAIGCTMEQAMEANIAKLATRYGDKFSTEKAINRDLESERSALEKAARVLPVTSEGDE